MNLLESFKENKLKTTTRRWIDKGTLRNWDQILTDRVSQRGEHTLMFSEAWLGAVLFDNHVATQVKHSEFKGKAVSIKYHFDWGFSWHKLHSRASIRWPIYLSSKHVISSLAFCLILTLSTLQFLFHWSAGSVSDSFWGESLLSGGDVWCPLHSRLQFCPYPCKGQRWLLSFWVLHASLKGIWMMLLCLLFCFVSL